MLENDRKLRYFLTTIVALMEFDKAKNRVKVLVRGDQQIQTHIISEDKTAGGVGTGFNKEIWIANGEIVEIELLPPSGEIGFRPTEEVHPVKFDIGKEYGQLRDSLFLTISIKQK